MRKFYTVVSARESANGYEILLDGRAVKTPMRHVLCTNNERIRDALVQEWAAQGEDILPDTMPATQFVSTKIDQVSQSRDTMSASVLKYFNTDLICYLAADPPELVDMQTEFWAPWRSWFAREIGYTLNTTTDIKAIEQLEAACDAVKDYVGGLDDDRFTVLQLVTPACGSLVLAMAFIEKQIDDQGVFVCARVEEAYKARLYNEEKYGSDPAQEKKDLAVQRDLKSAKIYLELL